MRRSTFTDQSVTYGAVGGTQAADLLYYPPKGYRPYERSARLGSGPERFAAASRQLMTWGVQRGSGMQVTDIRPGIGEQYDGVRFNDDGTPAENQSHSAPEERFGEDGTAYIATGMTATLRLPVGPLTATAPVRVVYVVDEERRIGFGYGSLDGHPLSGEESFVVEHRDDDSVWIVVRAFSRPSHWYLRLATPLLRLQQRRLTNRYLRALLPARTA